MAYCAADVFVAPSRQDNLPNTAIEAQACGTPVVAFDIGGLPDIVVHRESGWLAKAFDTADLAAGIQWVIEDAGRRARLGESARGFALERYSELVIARRYMDVYSAALSGKPSASG
jgi:glycosyltransferase involved in cell wall biosynthesis